MLAEALGRVRRLTVLHGGHDAPTHRSSLARFLRGDASVLIATDVAGQGLNLQSASRWVVNLELPWNPARLEQRIGRVDRLGQRRPVHASILIAAHGVETGVLTVLAQKAGAARRALGRDAFDTIAIDQARLRAIVIGGDSGGVDSTDTDAGRPERAIAATSSPIETRWRRPAHSFARELQRKRALGGPLRPGAPVDGRPHWSRPAVRQIHAGQGNVGLIFRVPLVDALSTEIERHLVAIQISAPLLQDRHSRRGAVAHARALARRRLAPRVERLRRSLRSRSSADADLERALSRALTEPLERSLVQEGLFDRRERSEADLAALERRDIDDDTEQRLCAIEEACSIEVGLPRLLLVLPLRP